MSGTPVDAAVRARARDDHAVSLVLEAGAGTGKTTLLVDRILALVRTGHARLDQIAAVTFTENAATTLKLRLRSALEALRSDETAGADERDRGAAALDVLERATISTIHALCAAILQERPLECGVVPGFRVADDAETELMFAEAWEQWLADRLQGGDTLVVEALDLGIPLEPLGPWSRGTLRDFARTLIEQRDLTPVRAETPPDPGAWRDELRAQAGRARELTRTVPEADSLSGRLGLLAAFADQAEPLEGADLVAHLRRLPTVPRNLGLKKRWPSPEALEEARGIAAWTQDARTRWEQALAASLHGDLVEALRGVTANFERRKRDRGVLDFLDLLLLTRDALRDREPVRRHFRERFRHVLIDEFQDTDPLQVEIARSLAGDEPGRLVVVGDAKQSIYRFRRAEVTLFRDLARTAGERPGWAVLRLSQNFRSRPALLRFVNRVFAELIQASDESGQPPYEPIQAPPGLEEGPAVLALRFGGGPSQGADLQADEADALARFVAAAANGAYVVRDTVTGESRPSSAGDVLVLCRRLTQLRPLEDALDRAGLRHVVDGGKSFFDRQEVHEALAVLRAVEDPGDHVALVAALRSAFFGVSDRDLVGYALAGGRLELGPVDPDLPGAGALGPALRLLAALHEVRTRTTPAALLERLYDETRIHAALTGGRRDEGAIANLEKAVTLARQAGELGVLTLRGFAALLRQRIETAREEPDLPVSRHGDPDTLRILSIHKAKGLEAPIVALYDTTDNYGFRPDVVADWERGTVSIGFRTGCQPPDWDRTAQWDRKRSWAESRRLLYVACTRARDWLVVPQPSGGRVGEFWRQLVEALPPTTDADVAVLHADTLPEPRTDTERSDLRALALAQGGDALAARWDAERSALIGAARVRPLRPLAVTRRVEAERGELALPPAAPGIGGREYGQLVHRLMEWIPFDVPDPAALAASMADALAPTLGLGAAEAHHAAEAVAAVLALPVIDRARSARRVWRELRLWFADGDDLLEGQVDLVFEEDDGLVVVDYKTDRITDAQALDQADRHKDQLRLYHRGLHQATGLDVHERLVVFTALPRVVPV